MANQDDFVGRIKSNWQQRADEHTTLRAELQVIPPRLKKVLWTLYLAGLVVVCLLSIFAPEAMPNPLVREPAAIRLLAMFGIVTAAAIAISLFFLFYGYIWADAKRRGMSPVLWLLVSLLVPYLIGVILYFVVREPLPLNCPRCGRAVNPHFNFCPGCQFNLQPNCPQCRRGIRAGDHFCPHCGLTLDADPSAQNPQPAG